MPTNPSHVRPVSLSSPSMISLWAKASVRIARDARTLIPLRSGVVRAERARISGAPLTSRQDLPSMWTTVDIRFRLPSKRYCFVTWVSARICM